MLHSWGIRRVIFIMVVNFWYIWEILRFKSDSFFFFLHHSLLVFFYLSKWLGNYGRKEKDKDTFRFKLYFRGLQLVGKVGRVFTNGLADLGSIPGRVIPKTFKKWYLIPLCLTLSHIRYVSRVK